jgi:hypothetical protein
LRLCPRLSLPLPPSNLPWESSSKLLELLSSPLFFSSLLLSILLALCMPPLRSLSSFVILFLLDFSLAPPQTCCYSIVGGFSSTGSDWCASSRSWPWIPPYFEVLRSVVFHLRSTNFSGQATHSIETTALPLSTHYQPFCRPAVRRWSVQPTRQIWTLSALIHTAICCQERFPAWFLHLRCFVFFLICIFLCWVMVSFGDPFTGSFVLLFVVSILFHI